MVSVCFRLLQIINLEIFQIGAYFRLASDWFQTGFILARIISDCVFRFHINSDCFHIHFRMSWKNRKNFRFCLHISDCFRLGGASTEEGDTAATASAKEEEDLQGTNLELWMDYDSADLYRRMEAAVEEAEIYESLMKEAAKEFEVKAPAVKAADSVSSAGTSSTANSASTAVSEFDRYPNYNIIVVGVAIIIGYTPIIIML